MSNTEKPVEPTQPQPSQPTAEELAQIRDDFHAFIGGFNSLTMATVNANGEPESSYAPFIQQDGCFYVFLSELASHTQNLKANPNVSLFWIEPEDQARNIFARTRATVFANADVIDRASDDGQVILDAMEEQLGNTMQVLRGLGDFHLFELTPQHGAYVTGFAKAFRLEGEGLQQVVHQQK
ncbi:HugZ family pyridoxamine 5'-phosphate oxidase [Oceanobacter kriegii]|uniref:HugZ family pyridoxamine 5'-phosphate oxidase n=1 Tax=Oceanobacter kriegii TaxID=64972 RepID=UPI00040CED4B|nr:pyridoxamine 5'-phosphate oxidase family protein [Oceanobacter kriegii]